MGDGTSRYETVLGLVRAELGDRGDDVASMLEAVCTAVVTRLWVQGAAVIVGSATTTNGVAVASDARARAHAELQFTTGEGPCHDAADSQCLVLVPDLAASAYRWPGYASAAAEAGVRAVFAFPLRVGAVVLGVLEIHHNETGSLGDDGLADALTFAQVATDAVLDGRLVANDGSLESGIASAFDYRAEVYQAQGMLLVALGITPTEALVRMRAYAFGHGVPLIDVARAVQAGHLLDGGGPPWTTTGPNPKDSSEEDRDDRQ